MLKLASDEDVHGHIIRGLRRHAPQLDLVRVQDILAKGVPDSDVLAWAVSENRVLITNDRNTMIAAARERSHNRERLPGLIVTTTKQAVGSAIEDILLIAECSTNAEMESMAVVFLPLD